MLLVCKDNEERSGYTAEAEAEDARPGERGGAGGGAPFARSLARSAALRRPSPSV